VSVWPAAQRKLTFLVPLGAVVGLAAVPVTTRGGNDLAAHLGNPAFIDHHRSLGSMVLPGPRSWSWAVQSAPPSSSPSPVTRARGPCGAAAEPRPMTSVRPGSHSAGSRVHRRSNSKESEQA
jgi:hypothetical protein